LSAPPEWIPLPRGSIARADVAAALLASLVDPASIRQRVNISSK